MILGTIFYPIIALIGWILGVHKREKWETIPLQKAGWPVASWTYKRAAGQHWVWKWFGNEAEGCEPWFKGRQWGFWEWNKRNRNHNRNWHTTGYAWYIEGDPYGTLYTEHLESRYPVKKAWVILSLVKPRKRPVIYWRPWIWLRGNLVWWHVYFWWGWKATRGQLNCSLEIRKKV